MTNIAIIAPSSVPYLIGGAENLWLGMLKAFNQRPGITAELIKIPSPERNFQEIISSYRAFADLNLDHFDQLISTKYPAWMTSHPNHVVYMQHKLRGLYDTYPARMSTRFPARSAFPSSLQLLHDHLAAPPDSDASLPELFSLLDLLSSMKEDLPGNWFNFPGPLIRSIIHMLDHIGLSTNSIQRYCAISKTVAKRKDYFPPNVSVEVFHHPTNLPGLHAGAYDYFFTASRLDPAKRIDLLIRAWIRAKVQIPLVIAGTGPQEKELKALASEHPKITFLEYILEDELSDYYADALAVLFVPYQEDYGLITVEAMLSSKAVLTTSDAGGVTELVEDGITGWIIKSSESSLADALKHIAEHPEEAIQFGKKAKSKSKQFSWPKLTQFLVQPDRPKLVVVNTFSVYPPISGGQLRIYHIYRHLARSFQVVLISLVEAGNTFETIQLQPGFNEIRVPKTPNHAALERALAKETGISVGDIGAIRYFRETPLWGEIIQQETQNAEWVIATHPYGYPAIRQVYSGSVIYEAHNVEADLKKDMLGDRCAPLAEQVKEVEEECIKQAPMIIACTPADKERLQSLYGFAAPTYVIPNGVDISTTPYWNPTQRAEYKEQRRQGKLNALFMGSFHKPNIEAANNLLIIASKCPEINFFILGGVCNSFIDGPIRKSAFGIISRIRRLTKSHPGIEGIATASIRLIVKDLPRNVHLLGIVSDDEKAKRLKACDIALNPIMSGSGSNLKILEAAASGQLIVSTSYGGRGGILAANTNYVEKTLEQMPDFLNQVLVRGLKPHEEMIQSARTKVESLVDWPSLAQSFRNCLGTVTK